MQMDDPGILNVVRDGKDLSFEQAPIVPLLRVGLAWQTTIYGLPQRDRMMTFENRKTPE
jgi:hypothetical protein